MPNEAQLEIKRLEIKAKKLQKTSEKLQDKLASFVAEKDVFMHEYQRQKLLVGLSADGQEVQEKLSHLDKNALQKLSAHQKLAYMKSSRVLENITQKSFQRILDELTPEQAYRLIRQRERERVREHLRYR